ncbi:MAG: DmsC/YnfH family molybdoenzyme membrane anchor subunit [Verrucomicrobiota bacterium]
MKLVPAVNLIDELLAEQQSLTAVERFSQAHENESRPLLEPHYRSLIPLTQPADGEQYTFEVDLEACSGCKACVTACHSLNGLDEGESWRDVGSLVSYDGKEATQQTVTSACHHCADPACANGCPTLAYEKEADTGIVHHLDDQCIGCQYCTMTCPYDVPKYNDRLGIVRKCDMCQSRLREGEAPACVQACPNEAIRIRIVPLEEVKNRPVNGSNLVPGTVPSRFTKPSTTYLNLRRPHGGVTVAADHDDLTPAHRHTPLVVMLVLTQAAAGLFLFDALARYLLPGSGAPSASHAVLGAICALAGLAGATLHLGRPLQAWRSFLGWRKSWLSREILAFGPWSGLAVAYAGFQLLTDPIPWPKFLPSFLASPLIGQGLAIATVLLGLAGVFCSVMVYVFTKRPFWSLPQTGFRFGFTFLAAGSVFVFPLLSALAIGMKLGFETWIRDESRTPFPASARIINGPLRSLWHLRLGLGLASLLMAVITSFAPSVAPVAFGLVITSELLARAIYFQAVREPKMPGGMAPDPATH